jgi:hypothetical protein
LCKIVKLPQQLPEKGGSGNYDVQENFCFQCLLA